MKKIGLLLFGALAVLSFASCKKDIPVTDLKFGSDTYYATEGQDCVVEYQYAPADHTSPIVWSSSNQEVAKVEADGKVKILKYGQTTLTISADGKKASCTLVVYADLYAHQWEYTDSKGNLYAEKYRMTDQTNGYWLEYQHNEADNSWIKVADSKITATNPAPGKYEIVTKFGPYIGEATAPDAYLFKMDEGTQAVTLVTEEYDLPEVAL